MENATLQVLSKCNITPKYKGYTYLPVAVRLADQYMREPLCIMADIYPVIGQIYDESPRKVERAIRIYGGDHGIWCKEMSWKRAVY